MAIKLTTTKEVNSEVKMFVYGLAGVGKTRLIRTAPKPLIISTEDRLMSLRKENIPVVKVENKVDFEQAYQLVKSEPKLQNFKTICIDSISDISETVIHELKNSVNPSTGKKVHGQQAYGKFADFMLPLIKKFRDLPGKHVYFIAKTIIEKDETTGLTYWRPLIPGQQITAQLPHLFDIICYMERVKNPDQGSDRKTVPVLHTTDGIQWNAKDHSGNLPPRIMNPHLGRLFEKALGETKKPKTKEKESEKEKIDLREDFENIENKEKKCLN